MAEEKGEYKSTQETAAPKKNTAAKLSSLDALRQKIATENGQQNITDKPLEAATLKAAWMAFVEKLKEEKRSSWQGYKAAELSIKEDCRFEVVVTNRIDYQFVEKERKEACEFLQKQLSNRSLQFNITLIEGPKEDAKTNAPLTAKDQYLKLVEEYPIVKELKDRLRLELDY